MIPAIKAIILLVLLLLFVWPLLPLPMKLRRFSTFYALKYQPPFNRRNFAFVPFTVAELVVLILIFDLFAGLGDALASIPFIGRLVSLVASKVSSQFNFVFFVLEVLVINLAVIYLSVFLKALAKQLIINPFFNRGKEKKKMTFAERRAAAKAKRKAKKEAKRRKKAGLPPLETEKEKEEEPSDEEKKKEEDGEKIMSFRHTGADDAEESDTDEKKGATAEEKEKDAEKPTVPKNRFLRWICGLFFKEPDYRYARRGVARAARVLQVFVYIVEALYILLFLLLTAMVLFPLPSVMYDLFTGFFNVRNLYVYPFLSLIFLQEICDYLHTEPYIPEMPEKKQEKEEKEEKKAMDARIQELNAELKKRFDADHYFRYYPEIKKKEVPEYVCSNRTYASALSYIRSYMEKEAGHVVESYMESLDASFNDNHVYFGTSFYSEYGEYLIAYTYTRLLSGARMIFITAEEKQVESLRKYIRDRLTAMTGSSENCTWRVYVKGERLDQADVLIATPDDFKDDSLVSHNMGFFEEVSNAVFVDAGRITTLFGYLCPIMAIRLQKATEGRVRFIFLSRDVLRGFASKILLRSFCIDKVFTVSSAPENEYTSYTLMNRESKNHRIYNKHGQTLTGLECMIAELARQYGVDGIKICTEAPMDYADKTLLETHGVEINEFYKPIPKINFMIYSDESFNLAAAIYTCTRFRGQKKSVVNIISKPYLLREYFAFMAGNGDYINRSSFIQPHVTEHIDSQKLSLLRILCEASTDGGMKVSEFCTKTRNVIQMAKNRFAASLSPFCGSLLANIRMEKFTPNEYAAYLVSGLYDGRETPVEESLGQRARDYYLITDLKTQTSVSEREKIICFKRTRTLFEKLLEQNRRVELRMNDTTVGYMDTFPNRVPQQYAVGQNLIFNNVEYEIEHIADDYRVIYLRCENAIFKNSLDTFFLRRYTVTDAKKVGEEGVLYNAALMLEEIRVSRMKADVVGESYGFYTLTSDRQTLDFAHGVEGNPRIAEETVKANARHFREGTLLSVTLTSKEPCTDRTRTLLAVVFNEFIKSIFPDAYRFIAICPVLLNPIEKSGQDAEDISERVRTLYPYLADGCFAETDEKRLQFLFINDCADDVGVLDWFYDGKAHYVQEFLSHVYPYLKWLSVVGKRGSYIYFGEKELPSCFDLAGACKLLDGFNMLLSDDGKDDFETAGDFDKIEHMNRCAFCHKLVDSGRYARFDKTRFICVDCFEVVSDEKKLGEITERMRAYLKKQYPKITVGQMDVAFDPVYELEEGKVLSEYYYRLDTLSRTVFVERDTPLTNAEVSVLRGLIGMWQADNNLQIPAAFAQLYFEELLYLKEKGQTESIAFILSALDADIRKTVEEIENYTGIFLLDTSDGKTAADESEAGEKTKEKENKEQKTGEPEQSETAGEPGDKAEDGDAEDKRKPSLPTGRTSFDYIVELASAMGTGEDDDDGDGGDDDDLSNPGGYSDDLYDPDLTPRFWKCYLRGITASEMEDLRAEETDGEDDGGDDDIPSDEAQDATEEEDTPED